MIKRISCRVVDSVPLSRNSIALRRTSRSDDKGRKSGDAITANASGPGNSVVYTGRLGITRKFADDSLIGQILDCYA